MPMIYMLYSNTSGGNAEIEAFFSEEARDAALIELAKSRFDEDDEDVPVVADAEAAKGILDENMIEYFIDEKFVSEDPETRPALARMAALLREKAAGERR